VAVIAAACLIAVVRWLMLAGLAGALGGVAGRGLARQYQGAAPAPLPPPWGLCCSVLGLAAAAALAAVLAGGHALASLRLHPAVSPLLTTGQAGITAIECAAFGLAAIALRLRRPGLSVLPLMAVVVAEAVRAHPEQIIPVAGALLSITHVLPAVLWAGMLFYALRAAVAWRHDPAAMRGLVLLYANAAVWLFAVVVITGVVTALVLVPLGSLLTTGYGIIVVIKAALVLAVAVLASLGRRWLGRAPVPGAGPARVSQWECYALAGVLAVTAVLTVLTPPAAPDRAVPARAVPASRPAPGQIARREPQPGADGTRTARAQGGASGASPPSRATTTRVPWGGASGQGVNPSVSTTVTAGRGRSAAAAAIPAPMSVPPPPTSSTCRAELTRRAGPTAVSQASTRT
jgi:putative copper export protein